MSDSVTDLVVSPAHQPELFDGCWPVDPDLESKAKEFIHTGKIACKDAERVERVCRAVLLRIPARAIARRERVGRETIDAMVAYAEQTGKLRPLAEALLTDGVEIAMLAGHALKEALEQGKVQPQCLGMVWGTAVDKIAGLTHSAGQGVAPKEGDDIESKVRAAWAAIARAKPASEPRSNADDAQVIDITPLPACDVVLESKLESASGAPGAPEQAAATTPDGGAGVTLDAPPRDPRWAGSENLEP